MNDTKYMRYETPGVTVDLVLFTVGEKRLKIMLTKRVEDPFQGIWSLPGGFLKTDESLDDAARRVLHEKTGVRDVYMEQLYTFSNPKRDPRSRVITVAYIALIPWQNLPQPASSKVSHVTWSSVDALPDLAFDHKQIIAYAVNRLRAKVSYSNIVQGLMPKHFRLSELQSMYECIINDKLDKRNFRKSMLATGLLKETGKQDLAGAHRPAMLYKFKTTKIVFF